MGPADARPHATSQDGFTAEWRVINLLTFEGDLINRCELFDDADIDAAIAKFDELDRPAPQLENAATRVRARVVDAYNRRDLDGFLALHDADGGYEDRRKGLRDSGLVDSSYAQALLFEASAGWHLEFEPVAIRGSRLALSQDKIRDNNEADRPVAVEMLILTEVADDESQQYVLIFDPDDINGAITELTARWIASGDVVHPEVIDSVRRLNETANRHEWDAIAARIAGATYINHRQLVMGGTETIDDYLSSIKMLASLVPDLRAELAEVLTHSAIGLVAHMVLKGTSTDGVAIEISIVQLTLLEGDRVTHVEAFDPDQRDLALARFDELSRAT